MEKSSSIDSMTYRDVFGRLPTGVTVITAYGEQGPVGMAANSVTSVSLDPALVLFCPAKSSNTWPAIEAAGRFCINIMASHHELVCRNFAAKDTDRYAGIVWKQRPSGPAVVDALASVDCEVHDIVDAGDHWIVIASVLELDVTDNAAPLVFFSGRYGTFVEPRPPASAAA
jgi:3-hydroxy-9,10-secoandrosta-1,3,5(10)-triene-9,17-dione monooxygenase reductase component